MNRTHPLRMAFLWIVFTVMVVACSSLKNAQDGVNSVRSEATFSREGIKEVKESPLLNPTPPSPDADAARDKLEAVDASQVRIIKITDDISIAMTGLQNKPNDWLTMLNRYWWIVGLIVVMAAVTALGGWGILRNVLSWVGVWIPKATTLQAEAGVAMLDPKDPLTPREAIAVQRASDPVYNRAFKKAEQQQILKQAKAAKQGGT